MALTSKLDSPCKCKLPQWGQSLICGDGEIVLALLGHQMGWLKSGLPAALQLQFAFHGSYKQA
jgi:hypothetical protein